MPGDRFFRILDTVDSTNNYAMAKVHAGMAGHGMAWFAREQTAGKGQRGKSWKSEPGKNITLSLVLQPERLNASQQFYLSAAIALACFDLFSGYAGEETKIKWPNDLFWRDRKAGGVLIENVFHGKKWKWAVAGIGININQSKFDRSIKKPVSLKQITGKEFDAIDLARELYGLLMKTVDGLDAGSYGTLIGRYNERLFRLNEKIILKKGKERFETTLKGVNKEGRLLTAGPAEQQFDFGEVEWVL